MTVPEKDDAHLPQNNAWSTEQQSRLYIASKKPLVIPTLCGRHVRLRPVQETDARTLYSWVSNPLEMYLWRGRRELVPFEIFRDELQKNLLNDLVHLLAVDLHTDQPLGWIFAYGYAIWEQRCFLVIYVVPEARRFGAAAEAGMLFLDYVFSYFPVRKVAAEVFSFNHISLHVLEHAGFHVEGVLRQEHYFGGHFYDVVRFGLLETEWRSLREHFRVGQLSHAQDYSISPERKPENGRQPTTDS